MRPSTRTTHVPPTKVRRKIVFMLAAFSLVSYVLRMNIAIAQQAMGPELRLGDYELSQVFSAFTLAYAIFQLPAGILADRCGPRFVLTLAALSWFVTTILTGLVPGPAATPAAGLVLLLALRFLLGVSEAATYPVAARAIANWVPASERAFLNSFLFVGCTVGSAFTPPLMVWVMQRFGWRMVFYLTALLPVLLAVAWWRSARDTPEQHAGVNADELAHIQAGRPPGFGRRDRSGWRTLLADGNMWLLFTSYFFDSYVIFIFLFWLFKYLVDVRKFPIASGGWATSLPYITAAILVPIMGRFTDRLSRRRGMLPGRRAVAIACQISAGVLLFAGARAEQAWIAVGAISLSVGLLMCCEGPYWSTAVEIAGPHAGAAGGLLNTWGNLGGVASTALVPVLVRYFGWTGALESGAILAVTASVLWMKIGRAGGSAVKARTSSTGDRAG